jgi:hypothetical protein
MKRVAELLPGQVKCGEPATQALKGRISFAAFDAAT